MLRRVKRVLPLLILLGSTAGCSGSSEWDKELRPDILLIVIDTLRADHCSVYGYPLPTTPNLAAIAATGVSFDAAYSPMSTTGPAHATLFTSLHPLHHGIMRNGLVLDEDQLTLAELLRQGGYRTAAFVSSFPVSSRFGFAQGFDHFDDAFDEGRTRFARWAGIPVPGGFDRSPAGTTDAALEWLAEAEHSEAPLFVFVHYFDPHAPLDPPAEYLARFASGSPDERQATIERYDAEIAYSDHNLGRIARAVRSGRSGREHLTLVTADHGEGLWEHGERYHNRTTYEEEVRIPLVLQWVGRFPSGERISAPVQLVDLMPTILSAAGIETPTAAEGLDLGLLIQATNENGPRSIYLQRPYYEGAPKEMFDALRRRDRGFGFGLRRGPWKFFEARTEGVQRLFDLENDPHERRNIAAQHPDLVATLASEIDRFAADRAMQKVETQGAVPAEVLEGLRALGYAEPE